MSLQSLYDDLAAALHDGVIDLTGTVAPDLDRLLEAIGVAPGDGVRVSGASLSLGTDAVVLTGTAAYRSFQWSATLTGEPVPAGNRFSLTLLGQDRDRTWTFGTSFDTLPQSRTIGPKRTLVTGPSVLAPMVVQQPALSVTTDPDGAALPSPRLEGWLVLSGSALETYSGYLAAPRLRLDGHVDFRDRAKPVLRLRGAAPGADVDIPPAHVTEVGIELRTDYPDREGWKPLGTMSAAALYAKTLLGSRDPLELDVSAALLQGDAVWPLSVGFPEPLSIADVIGLVTEAVGVDDPGLFSVPLAGDVLDAMGLSSVEFGVIPPLGGRRLGLSHMLIQFQSKKAWKPPIPLVTIEQVGTGWNFHFDGDDSYVTGDVWGVLDLLGEGRGEPTEDMPEIKLLVAATIPDFDILGATLEPIPVPLQPVLERLLGGSAAGLDPDLAIERVVVQASPKFQTYQASLSITGLFKLSVGKVTFALERLLGDVVVTQSRLTGSISGFAAIEVDDAEARGAKKANFIVSAAYRGTGVWRFEGGLADGTLSVLDFAWGLLGERPGADLPQIDLTELWLTYETSEGRPYSARGALAVRWQPELLGQKLSLVAKASVARRVRTSASDEALALVLPERADAAPDMILEGSLSGTFTISRLTVTAGVSFLDKTTTYMFEVLWDGVGVRAETRTLEQPTRHQALAITLRGLTLGGVVEYLIRLANPNANFRLEPPWNVLNSIDLSKFTLVVDPKYQSVELTYEVGLDLGFMSVKTVGLRYDRSSGTGTVKYVLTGNMLGKPYTPGAPLTWDAVNDPPPQVPGKGVRLVDIRYLGMGQHVALSAPPKTFSVADVLAELRKEMKPVADPTANPIPQSKLRFDESSQWMLGLDITVIDTVSVGLVMHDPDLYGIVVGLSGAKAKALAGLRFELLYKKVTDDVGVFRVRLQIPDAFRQINLGYVAITLGVITVDVYTNGDFMIDLGFPHNRDFKDSFGLEAGPFIGSGGLYFGVLSGATSSRVPAITNGSFDPVIELGIGLAVGVGRTFNKGPLKAGLYVQVVAIFEGVFAWFNPTDAGASSELYYWGRGSAGIIGKLYGSVDFKVISVDVSIEASAIATLTFAAYRETLVELDVRVSVHASVKIVFFRVSFSFGLQLRASFTLGSRQASPWKLADPNWKGPAGALGDAAVPQWRHRAGVRQLSRQAFLAERHGREAAAALLAAGAAANVYDLHWDQVNVFPDGAVHPVTVKMLPAYAVDAVPVQWPGQPVPSEGSAEYRIAFLLMADDAVPPEAESFAERQVQSAGRSATARDVEDTSFNVLVDALLRWALSAIGLDPVNGTVSAGQLTELERQMDLPETANEGFAMGNLAGFLARNVELRVSGMPAGERPDASGTAFPIPPPLGWEAVEPESDPAERRFQAFREIDATYEREVAEYFAPLDPRQDGAQRAAATPEDDDPESMATFVFRDYFLMVAKAAVQAALDLLASFPYPVAGDSAETLDAICAEFHPVAVEYAKRAGDTVDQVAGFYGLSRGELLALNPGLPKALEDAAPGAPVAVKLGATPEGVAAANPDWPLTAGLEDIALGDLVHQVRADETFAGIAAKLGADVEAWLQDLDLLATPRLLRDGAPLAVPAGATFHNADGLALDLAAAFLFVRLREPDDVPLVEWYVEAVARLNPDVVGDQLPAEVLVPRAFEDLSDPLTWRTQPGDTLSSIAAYHAAVQHQTATPGFEGWLADLRALNPGPDPVARVILPATSTPILGGERLVGLALRLPLELPDPSQPGGYLPRDASFRRLVEGAPILSELQPVTVPGCTASTVAEQTLGSFAALYDLAPEDAGRRLAAVPGVLAAWTDHTLAIPHPGAVAIGSSATESAPAELVPAVLRHRGAQIGGQVSRFMLHGLRMPAPEKGDDGRYHATGPMTGLYELIGQQITGPAPAPEPPAEPTPPERLEVTVKVYDTGVDWVKLYASSVLTGGEDLAPLAGLNPGLRHRDSVEGIIALTDPVAELVYQITDADLHEWYPATKLEPVFDSAPAALDPRRDVPVRHDLQQRILWQTTEAVALPDPAHVAAPLVGMPTVWPFPAGLVAAAEAFPTRDFALCASDPQLGPSAEPSELSRYAWATTVELGVRRIPGRPRTYELLGADTAGRQVLLELWRYLTDPDPPDSATLHLLYQPPASTGLPSGYASAPLDATATYLVKTNLSTETRSGSLRVAEGAPPPSAGEYYASIADALEFLTIAWECSVVGGGGYWLEYTAADGSGLPDSIFGAEGGARLTLLAALARQTTADPPSRLLHPFNNCAVVGESVDASGASLFARIADRSETVPQATVSPGESGFRMQLRKPPPNPTPPDPQIALRDLYSLVGYRLGADTVFEESREGRPIGPQTPPEPLHPGEPDADEDVWDVFQVVPLSRFAADRPLPEVDGLPNPAADPYAGVRLVDTPDGQVMASAPALLTFRDVLGNASLGREEAGGPDAVPLPGGYTDPVIGVSAWPATTASFRIGPGEPGALLTGRLALQASTHVAAASQRASEAGATAAGQLPRFTAVYYQLGQADVRAALWTTLEEAEDGPARLDVELGPLRDFAAGACAWLATAAALVDVPIDPAQSPTLADVSERHGVGFEALAAANGGVRLDRLFTPPPDPAAPPGDFTVPVYAPFRDGESVASLVPPGDDPVEVLKDAENASLPLRAGTELVVPERFATVPPDPLPPGQPKSLAELAADIGVTAPSLARANAARPGLLRVGFVFTCNDVEVEVTPEHPDVTLDDVAATLRANGVPYDGAMAAGANAALPGMFRPGVDLAVDRYLIRAGDTLAENHSGVSVANLPDENATVADLFDAGAPVYVAHLLRTDLLDRSLSAFSEAYGVPPDQLLRHNRHVPLATPPQPLPEGEWPAVPGHAALPEDAAGLRVPYRIPPDARLADVAALFMNADPAAPSAAVALAQANLELPGVIAGGKTIEAGGQTVSTEPGDSFGAVLARFDPSVPLADVVAYVAERPAYLAGALLLCPPAVLPAGGPLSPLDVAARYGVEVAEIATANAALAGLVAPGAELSLTAGDGRIVTVTTGAADSLNSLVWRFARAGVETTVAEAVTENADAPLFAGGAALLLAPAAAEARSPIGAGGWRFPGAIFPLHVWLEIARDPRLVVPALRGSEAEPAPAVRDRSALPPLPAAADDSSRALALERFATELRTAIPVLRAATGKVLSEQREANPADVWAMAFGAGYVEEVRVAPRAQAGTMPEYFALRPLTNSLVSRKDVGIAPLVDGTLATPVPMNFQGIDMETWAARFLADVDLFLSAPYAAGVYRTAKRASLEKALAAKRELAGAIVRGLDYVLDLGQPDPNVVDPPADWRSASESLRQRLLVGLADGYTTDVVVQYGTQVKSPWKTDWARLSGAGRLPGDPSGEQRRTAVSSAKTSLAEGSSYVNFLVSVAEEGRQRSVRLPLDYAVNEVEFAVADVVSGYQSSNWLSFVLPFAHDPPPGVSFELGTPDAPLPLRAYPPLPALLGQESPPSDTDPQSVEDALRWDYAFTYQHQSMAPDRLALTVDFNQPPRLGDPGDGEDDLFAQLAQYVAVAPELWEALDALADPGRTPDTKVENAIGTFADLAARVAARWSDHWSPEDGRVEASALGGPTPETYGFTARLDSEWDPVDARWYYTALVLSRDRADGPLGWPSMGYFEPGQPVVDLGPGVDVTGGRRYAFPPKVEAFGLLGYEMRFERLHVASYQTAQSEVQVTRNAQLLDGGPPTRAGFVYQTQTLAFPSPTAPLLSWDRPFEIAPWIDPDTDNPLVPVFQAMFDGDASGRKIDCAILYGYELGGTPPDALVTYLPVKFRPKFDYAEGTPKEIADAVAAWQAEQQPATDGAEWVFGLSLYSTVVPTDERPLLQLRRLSSRVSGPGSGQA